MSTAVDDPTLEVFFSSLAAVRERIEKIILFGSRARGDEKPYSDYDLLLVVSDDCMLRRRQTWQG